MLRQFDNKLDGAFVRGHDGAPFQMVHVVGADRDEIYFAVRRREGRTAIEAYEVMRQGIPDQYPGATFSPLAPRELRSAGLS